MISIFPSCLELDPEQCQVPFQFLQEHLFGEATSHYYQSFFEVGGYSQQKLGH